MGANPPVDLEDQILKLIKDGPEKIHPCPRLIRIYLDGQCLCSTTSAIYVWEKPWYPWLYIPAQAIIPDTGVKGNVEWESGKEISVSQGGARFWKATTRNDKSTGWRVVQFQSKGKLSGYVRVDFGAVDQWFEEDVPIHVHPKDPFKRVDVLPSSRNIRVFSLDGVLLADAKFSMHLHETGLPTRFYIPVTAMNTPRVVLTKSQNKTACPYKGIAEYYNVSLRSESNDSQDKLVGENLVWYYNTPNLECAGIAGMACFYNEKVQIEIDGVQLEKPTTHLA